MLCSFEDILRSFNIKTNKFDDKKETKTIKNKS